jgi:tungstate transport system permease protein
MLESLKQAFILLFTFDREIYTIAFTSIWISFLSTLLAGTISVPMVFWLDFSKTPFKRASIALLNSMMALPTVVIGLFIYGFISRSGFFGRLGLLFTPTGIIIGQTILAIPVISSIILSGFSIIDTRLYETLRTLGARRLRLLVTVLYETRYITASAVLAGFGRVIGEVGVSMMLGGNIRWYTRTLTTAIAMETSKGEFSYALSLGIILITIALGINFTGHGLLEVRKRIRKRGTS